VARQQNHLTCRNINGLAGVVDSILRNKSTSAESVSTTPAGKAQL